MTEWFEDLLDAVGDWVRENRTAILFSTIGSIAAVVLLKLLSNVLVAVSVVVGVAAFFWLRWMIRRS